MDILRKICRFCLKEPSSQYIRMYRLDEHIEQLFYELTNYKLIHFQCPNSVCEICYKDLLKSIDVKKAFIDNQIEIQRKFVLFDEEDIKHELLESENNENQKTHFLENSFEALTQTDVIYEQSIELIECSELHRRIETHNNQSDAFENKQSNESLEKTRTANRRQQCSVCGNFVKNLTEHLKFTHNQARKNFFCDICGYSCYFKTKIERHLQKHIPKEFRNLFQCPKCTFLCSRKDALKSHILIMHQINRSKNFQCDHCKKSFYNRSQLNIHVRSVHQNIRDYLCNECGKAFFRVKDLKIHSARHYDKKEKCNHCDMLFFAKADLMRHIRHRHNGPASITCQIADCQRKFHTNSQLKVHIKAQHENIKEFICNFCGANFKQYNNKKRHVDSVHKSLRIHCVLDDCEYSISRKDKYKIHLLKVHKNIDEETRSSILKNVKYQ